MAALDFRDGRLHSFCIRDHAATTGHSLDCLQHSAISVQSTRVTYLERTSVNQRACHDPASFRGRNNYWHSKASSLNECQGERGHETGRTGLFIDDVVLLLANIGVNAQDAENTLLGGSVLLRRFFGGYADCGASH